MFEKAEIYLLRVKVGGGKQQYKYFKQLTNERLDSSIHTILLYCYFVKISSKYGMI